MSFFANVCVLSTQFSTCLSRNVLALDYLSVFEEPWNTLTLTGATLASDSLDILLHHPALTKVYCSQFFPVINYTVMRVTWNVCVTLWFPCFLFCVFVFFSFLFSFSRRGITGSKQLSKVLLISLAKMLSITGELIYRSTNHPFTKEPFSLHCHQPQLQP